MTAASSPLNDMIVVRGGGDLATGVIQKFHRSGMRVLCLETAQPTAIRRSVSLCEAVYDGRATVEDLTAQRIADPSDCDAIWAKREIPVLVDPQAECLSSLSPSGLVDCILAKRNLGTALSMAPIVLAAGPGFSAPDEVHAVVETKRGHDLGKVIFHGAAQPNTGIPGVIQGHGADRVLRAPCAGVVQSHRLIGDAVQRGDAIFSVEGQALYASFPGLLRGLLREGLSVRAGMKVADIDPRMDSDWHSISDKARCIGGGVLEAYLFFRSMQQ